jgi:hypothetical protein
MLRVATTSLRGGQVLIDYLPITVTQLDHKFMSHGSFSGDMPVNSDLDKYRSGIVAGKTLLWVLDDTAPLWAGVIWEWNQESALDSTFQLTAESLTSIFDRRVISESQSWTNSQPYVVFEDIVDYALNKTYGDITNIPTPRYRDDGASLIAMTRTYQSSDYTVVWDALTSVASDGGFEFDLRVSDEPNTLTAQFVLGTEISRPIVVPTLTYPGNVIDFSYPYSAKGVATNVRVTGSASSSTALVSAAPHGVDTDALTSGNWPLLETVISAGTAEGITQGELDTRADTEMVQMRNTRTIPEVSVTCGPGGLDPRDVKVGDRVNLSLNSTLHGLISAAMRVISITYIIDNNTITGLKLGLG